MPEGKLFSRNFMILMTMGFCFTATYLLIYICMANLVEDRFDRNASFGGLAACIFVLGSFLSRILLARYVDIVGRKRCLIISILMNGVATLLYLVVPNFLALLLLRVFQGFAYGLGMLTINSLIADFVPASRRSEGIGYYMLSYTMASAIGPYLSMYFLHNGGYDFIFMMAMVLMTIPLVTVGLLKVEQRVVSVDEKRSIRELRIDNFIEKSALKISIVIMIFFFAYSSVITFVSEYGDTIGLTTATSYFFLMIAISTFFSRILVGKVADMYGDNVVLVPCLFMFTIALVMMSVADSAIILLTSAFMIGFGVALVNSVGQSIAIRQSEPKRYPICMSTFQIFMDISNGFGPFLFGTLIVLYGFRSMYLIAAGMGAISLILYLILHGFKLMNVNRHIKKTI